MAVQDDQREREMCHLLGLREGVGRSGVDAFLEFEALGKTYAVPIELKSTTNYSISTARDVGISHIAKWRSRVWVFGFYNAPGTALQKILTLGPADMEEWIGKIESYIAPDFAIGQRIAEKLDFEDLHIICGEKPKYSLHDAMILHKRQWSTHKYRSEMDDEGGYTPAKMLEILRLRAIYLNQRGSTLNNPHIPASFFAQFESEMIDTVNTNANEVAASTQRKIRQIALAHKSLQQTR